MKIKKLIGWKPTISINQVLTNLTNTPQTAIYNVSSVANTCASASFSVTVNVLPKPIISAKNKEGNLKTPEEKFIEIMINYSGANEKKYYEKKLN
jgi:hypothetical protein